MIRRIAVSELQDIGIRFLTNEPSAQWHVYGKPIWEFPVMHMGKEKILQVTSNDLYEKLQKFDPIGAKNLLIQKARSYYHVRQVKAVSA